MKIYTEGFFEDFEEVTVNFNDLIHETLKSKGFVLDNLKGKHIYVKGFTFVIVEERKWSEEVDKKKVHKKEISSLIIGSDIAGNKMYGKGLKLDPRRITDLIVALDYFDKMENK